MVCHPVPDLAASGLRAHPVARRPYDLEADKARVGVAPELDRDAATFEAVGRQLRLQRGMLPEQTLHREGLPRTARPRQEEDVRLVTSAGPRRQELFEEPVEGRQQCLVPRTVDV